MDKIKAILFEPIQSHARYNLEGALYDIERFSKDGLPTDKVCVDTIRRVIKQLAEAENA